MPDKADKKKINGYSIVLISIFFLLFCPNTARCITSNQLHLENLAQVFKIDADKAVKAEVLKYLINFVEEGFAATYQVIYEDLRENRVQQKWNPMLALIMICHNFDLSPPDRIAGKRLFLKKLRQKPITSDSLVSLAQLNQKTGLFKEKELENLFQSLVRQVWAKNFKTELNNKKGLDNEMKKFLENFSWLKIEIEASLALIVTPEEKWEYVLIEGRSGENEGDFELKKVK